MMARGPPGDGPNLDGVSVDVAHVTGLIAATWPTQP